MLIGNLVIANHIKKPVLNIEVQNNTIDVMDILVSSQLNDVNVEPINQTRRCNICAKLGHCMLIFCWLILSIIAVTSLGYSACMFLFFVFRVDWDIDRKSLIEQFGVFFGTGVAILFVISFLYLFKKINE